MYKIIKCIGLWQRLKRSTKKAKCVLISDINVDETFSVSRRFKLGNIVG